MVEVDDSMASDLGLSEATGVQVLQVLRTSPAHRAGILPGDVILKWNGQPIDDPAELSLAVVRTEVGSEATVELSRDGRPFEVAVKVGERPIGGSPR
jgi:serine protease Do